MRDWWLAGDEDRDAAGADAVAPGKRSLTGQLCEDDARAAPSTVAGKSTLTQRLAVRATSSPVPVQRRVAPSGSLASAAIQRREEPGGPVLDDPFAIHLEADKGVAGPSTALPFAEQIQRSFGPAHDVSGIRAHVGGPAAAASEAIGATAYATGEDVAFASTPDLHTAAHEAAHVVQQRAGVQLYGGVGVAGDPFELHADAVADRVVAGQSAADLLAPYAGAAPATTSVQRQPAAPTDDSAARGPASKPGRDWPVFAGTGKPFFVEGSVEPDVLGRSGQQSVWVMRDWILKAADKQQLGPRKWRAPSCAREVLQALGWVDPARLERAAATLAFTLDGGMSTLNRVQAATMATTGLPVGATTFVSRSSDGGIDVALAIPESEAAPGARLTLTDAHRAEVLASAARFTGLPLTDQAHDVLASEPELNDGVVGNQAITVHLEYELCEALFGGDAFAKWAGQRRTREDRTAPRLKPENYFNQAVPGEIVHFGELIEHNESVNFQVRINWPWDFPDPQFYDVKPVITPGHVGSVAIARCHWSFRRLDGKTQQPAVRVTSLAEIAHRFKLDRGEPQGTWEVAVHVERDDLFLPTDLRPITVTVKQTDQLMAELRDEAFEDLVGGNVETSKSDFDAYTSGSGRDIIGKRTRADLPGEFVPTAAVDEMGDAAGSHADGRTEVRGQRLEYLQATKLYLIGTNAPAETIEAVDRAIATHMQAERLLTGDVAKGWQPFEVRGTYLSREEGLPSGALMLYGTVHRDYDDPKKMFPKEVVVVQIRDLSMRFDNEVLTVTGQGPTFEEALRFAFLDLAKAYPNGVMAVQAEEIDDAAVRRVDGTPGIKTGRPGSGKSIGFELGTDSRWKRVKAKVWDTTVNVAVNLGAIAIMTLVPGSAAVIAPAVMAYNSTAALDRIGTESAQGTLTMGELAISVGEVALNILPAVGAAKPFSTRWFLVEGLNWGGQGLLMVASALEEARKLQAQDVRVLVQLYQELEELLSNPFADPREVEIKRREIAERARAAAGRIEETLTNNVVQNGVVALGASATRHALSIRGTPAAEAMARHIAQHATGSSHPADAGHPDGAGHVDGAGHSDATPGAGDASQVGDPAAPAGGSSDGAPLATRPDPTNGRRPDDSTSNVTQPVATSGSPSATGSATPPQPDRPATSGPRARVHEPDAELATRPPERARLVDADQLAHERAAARDRYGETSTEIHYVPEQDTAYFDATIDGRRTRVVAKVPPRIKRVDELLTNANRVVGTPLADAGAGHATLRALVRGDLQALVATGVHVPDGTQLPPDVEFGLGQLRDGRVVIVRGEGQAVDWSALPGVRAIGHTHPDFAGNDLPIGKTGAREVSLAETTRATPMPYLPREAIYPSTPDIAMMAREGIAEHRVFTPYVLRDGMVSKPAAGDASARLEFVFRDAVYEGSLPSDAGPGKNVYRARLEGVVDGKVVLRTEVWAIEGATLAESNLSMTRPPMPEPVAPAAAAPRRGVRQVVADGYNSFKLHRELAAGSEDLPVRPELEVLSIEDFKARTGSESARAVFLPGRPGSGGIIIARADATPLHIREELAHARQATTSMRRDMVAVNEVIAAGDWRDRSARDRLNVFRKKLEIEVHAHEGLLAAATSTPAERAHAADTLSELQRLSAEVDGFTDLDIDDMNAGLRPLPQYLESPAWLASKVKSRERHLDLASNTHPTAMVVLPKAGPERSAAYNTRDGVSEIRRIGYEWDEMTYVNADHGGRVSFMREAEGPVAIITDARGVAHRYVLEPDGRRQASDGDVVEPGTVLATEPRRYREIEIETADGAVTRSTEIRRKDGDGWIQRGSESTRRGAIMEAAARDQFDAQLAAKGIVDAKRIEHRRGGGGFDDVVALFDGPPDQPTAKLVIREVKGHIDGYVPIEEFSAIRPPGLQKNLEVIADLCEASMSARMEGRVDETQFQDLSEPQVQAVLDAVLASHIEIQVVLGPSARLGAEGGRNSRVIQQLRAEAKDALRADVLAGPAGGYVPERIDPTFVKQHTESPSS